LFIQPHRQKEEARAWRITLARSRIQSRALVAEFYESEQRPSLASIELSGSVAVLGWNGTYDSHEANSSAKNKSNEGLIEALSATHRIKLLRAIKPEFRRRDWEDQWDLSLINFNYVRIDPTPW
jgi:hypothetical protein